MVRHVSNGRGSSQQEAVCRNPSPDRAISMLHCIKILHSSPNRGGCVSVFLLKLRESLKFAMRTNNLLRKHWEFIDANWVD